MPISLQSSKIPATFFEFSRNILSLKSTAKEKQVRNSSIKRQINVCGKGHEWRHLTLNENFPHLGKRRTKIFDQVNVRKKIAIKMENKAKSLKSHLTH